MTITEWIVGGGLLGILVLILAQNKESDAKVRRVYQRLDETKDYQDKTFTRSDVCHLRHEQITEKLDKIDAKLDKIINGKA